MAFLSSATVTFTDNSVGQSAVTPGIAWSGVRIQSKPHFVLDVITKREKLNLRTLLDVSNIIIKSEKCEVSKLLKELKFELRSSVLHYNVDVARIESSWMFSDDLSSCIKSIFVNMAFEFISAFF